MSVFYIDYANGNDSTTTTPYGWWRVAYTNGSASGTPGSASLIAGTAGGTAYMTIPGTPTTGTWLGGNAAGTLYFYGKSGTFAAGTVSVGTIGSAYLSSDPSYCAWATIGTGASGARIAAGDVIRITKSPDPTPIGSATWTSRSITVTLGSAQTQNVELCNGSWSPGAGGDITHVLVSTGTDGKEGTACARFVFDSSPQTSKLQAYRATGSLDLSSYSKLSFWIKNSAAIATGNLNICLCSDTAGAVVVDTIAVPAIPSTSYWTVLNLSSNSGTNFGGSIQSVALYTGTVAPTASGTVFLDDIIACTTDGLNLTSLISKNSSLQGGDEAWLCIQSINGTTVKLDTAVNTLSGVGRGYYTTGTSPETVMTYKRETIKTPINASANGASNSNVVRDAGSLTNPIEFQGGFDSTTNLQTGETFFDGSNGCGYGIYCTYNYVLFNWIAAVRYYYGLRFDGVFNNVINLSNANNNTHTGLCLLSKFSYYNNVINLVSNANYGGFTVPAANLSIGTVSHANSNYVCGFFIQYCSNVTIGSMNCHNNTLYGVYFYPSASNTIRNLTTAYNDVAALASNCGGIDNYIYNAHINESVIYYTYTFGEDRTYLINQDGTPNNNWIYSYYSYANLQNTVRHTESGYAWRMTATSSTYRGSLTPFYIPIARIACSGSKQVTFSTWMSKGTASGIEGRIRLPGLQIAGVDVDVTATQTAGTAWEQLSLQFTPTESGVVEVYADCWSTGAASSIYIDDASISEAV